MRFESPWVLVAALPALGLVWWIARRGRVPVPRRQRRMALALRGMAVSALVVALAGPQLILPTDDRAVVFLVDRSDSIGDDARAFQDAYLRDAVDAVEVGSRWSVVVFGGDVRVDRSLAVGHVAPAIRSEVDPSATDVESALRSVAALLPSGGSRRVVVLSDLAQTRGSVLPVIADMAASGIAVDVVSLPSSTTADALVDSVQMPAVARQGDEVTARLRVNSNRAGQAVIEVRPGDGDPIEVPIDLVVGTNEVEVPISAGSSGFLAVTARVVAAFDTRPQNDLATGLTRVLGPPRVAVVEGTPGEGDALARALQAGGMEADLLPAVPGDAGMLLYDGIVLVNVEAPDDDTGETLRSFVEDLGRGLVVVGGDQAYGMGSYEDSVLESLLPVSSNPDDLVRRQPVAEVLVIDTSGSMAACHCDGGSGMDTTGINKTDISRAGAEAAIKALAGTDRVGVLAFSSGFDWVLPLATKPSDSEIVNALSTLTPQGDTEISRALEEALAQLRGAPEQLKHMVLFTDGWDPTDADLLPVARRIAEEGVTLSVLGTGEGPGHTLERMADIGGGRYYPGRDLEAIPEIFVEETLTVARNLINEGRFLPVIAGRSQVTDDLTATPPLLGFVLTKPKGTARVALEVDQGDPLLATWQRGLGRATAWTSDATDRWSAGWVSWGGFVDFWGSVVRDVLPAGRETPPEVEIEGGRLRVVAGFDEVAEGSTATARVRHPDGSTVAAPLSRISEREFSGSLETTGPGAYWVAVTVTDPSGGVRTVSSGAVSSYEPEFAFRAPDPQLAPTIVAQTGGILEPQPAQAWERAPVIGTTSRDTWPWWVASALGAFFVDVALRRLVFSEGDVEEWRQGVAGRRRRERRRVAEVTAARQETPDAAPEVVSDSETLQRLMRRKNR